MTDQNLAIYGKLYIIWFLLCYFILLFSEHMSM